MSGPRTPTISSAGVSGAQLRAGREAAGWSRTDLSQACGLSVAVIARIELRGNATAGELDLIREALQIALGEVVMGEHSDDPVTAAGNPAVTPSPVVTGFLPEGTVRVSAWEGLKHGDLVKVSGEKGRFKFLYHSVSPQDEHIGLSGPVVRREGRLIGERLRCIRPERIIRPPRKG